MSRTTDDPGAETAARLVLQRVATHVLARARFAAGGRFGLRVTADGIATPAFGPDGAVLRIAGEALLHERQGSGPARTTTTAIDGAPLRVLAGAAGVDLDVPFNAGGDTIALGDPDAPIDLPDAPAAALLAWFCLGAAAVDAALVRAEDPSVVQLWPEHFDVGFDAATVQGRVNLGASPGDAAHPEPYLYVSPWDESRPGDPGYWNAPFGAVVGREELDGSDPLGAATDFLLRGLRHLG